MHRLKIHLSNDWKNIEVLFIRMRIRFYKIVASSKDDVKGCC